MLVEVLTFLRALPALVRAIERLSDVGTALAAQQRKDEKDQLVIDLIAAARERCERCERCCFCGALAATRHFLLGWGCGSRLVRASVLRARAAGSRSL